MIGPAAHAHPTQLFDPADAMVGQEDRLMARMAALALVPKIAMCVFAFHFKSVTVAAASIQTLKSYAQQEQAANKSPETAAVQYSGTNRNFRIRKEQRSANGTVTVSFLDIRDDLRFYHPEEESNYSRAAIDSKVSHTSLLQPPQCDERQSGASAYVDLYSRLGGAALGTEVSLRQYPTNREAIAQLKGQVTDSMHRAAAAAPSSDVSDAAERDVFRTADVPKLLSRIGALEDKIAEEERIVIGFAISGDRDVFHDICSHN
jgi:hypothetical protein